MANPRTPYFFSTERAPLAPPAGGSIIAHVVVNVEHWLFEQPMPRTIITPPHGKETVPDVPNFSWADYGMRCGLPRIIDALASRGLPASTSFNAGVIDAYPRAAEAMHHAGWEFIGHGLHQKSLNHGDSEADVIGMTLQKIESFTGTRPRGWLSPGLRETVDTPEHLKAAGVEYVFDWVIDDLPTWLTTARGPLLSVPYNLELNDSIIYAVEKHSSPEYLLRVQRTLELFRRESQRQPRVLTIALHPHLMGVPHRFGYLEQILDLLAATPEVTFMTGAQIAQWYQEQCPAPASSSLGYQDVR
ncbi:MAG TPA: polysaccharide deacetylase family protein [Paraburkholderia sp.]|jgi:peptidoglycan/xylan/chitin deacetylase (PgdA/CDA1 family)|nr:polysaccharide deacetylase family protein [Paraburkholderia sp.]